MAEIKTFNFMTLENLTTYHGELKSWVEGQISDATASSIKTVSISKDETTGVSTMHFYTVDAPVGEAQAAFSIELPYDYYTTEQIDGFIETINGNIDALSAKVGVTALGEGETVMGRVADAEGDIVDLKAIVSALTGDEEGSVGSITEAIEDAIEALDLANTYEAKGAAEEVQGALDSYIESNDAAVAGKADKATTLEGYGITDAMTATAIAEAIQAAVEAEAGLRAEAEAAIAEDIAEVDEKADGIDAALTQYKTDNDARVKAIEDDYLTSVEKAALDEKDAELEAAIEAEKARMDAFMKLEDGQTLDEALDSLKELQTYITSEAAEADVIVGKVAALEAIVDGIGGEGEEATVVAYVQKAIEALKIGDYATVEALNGAIERIAANEKAISDMDTAYKAADAKVVEDMTALVEAEKERAMAAESKAQSDAEAKAAELDAALKSELTEIINGVDAKFAGYYTKEEADAAIDADVLVETNRATAAEEALSGRIDTLETVVHSVEAIAEDDIKALFA